MQTRRLRFLGTADPKVALLQNQVAQNTWMQREIFLQQMHRRRKNRIHIRPVVVLALLLFLLVLRRQVVFATLTLVLHDVKKLGECHGLTLLRRPKHLLRSIDRLYLDLRLACPLTQVV